MISAILRAAIITNLSDMIIGRRMRLVIIRNLMDSVIIGRHMGSVIIGIFKGSVIIKRNTMNS